MFVASAQVNKKRREKWKIETGCTEREHAVGEKRSAAGHKNNTCYE